MAPLSSSLDGSVPRDLMGPVLSLKQLWVILRARRMVIAASALVLAVLAAAFALLQTRYFESTSTLVVAFRGDDSSSNSDLALSSYFATQIEFIQSSAILLPVVDQFKLTEREDYLDGYVGDRSPDSLRLWATGILRKQLTVGMGEGSFFIYVSIKDENPIVAAQLANAIADRYMQEQVQRVVNPAKERAVLYSEQVKSLKAKVDEAQAKVTAFRQRTGMIDLSGLSVVDSSRLQDLDARLTEATARRRDAELRLARIGEGDATVLASPLVQTLKTELQQKEGQLSELRASLGGRHPQILSLKAEIEHVRAQLNREISVYSGGARADVSAAREVESKLTSELSGQRRSVLDVRTQQDEAAMLLRELDSATRIYQGTLDAFDKVQMGAEVAVSNVSIVSRASPATKPIGRGGLKLVLLALIGGAIGSAIFSLLWELMHRRVRCREDMEQDLNIPVLMELKSAG